MYKLIKDSLSNQVQSVQRLSDNAYIPFDSAKSDYIAYLAWVAEGNRPLPADTAS